MKLCECGCGLPAPLSKQTYTRHGLKKGDPCRFILGHYPKTDEMKNKARETNLGTKNGTWKGDAVKYHGVHGYIKRHLEKPPSCPICGKDRFVELTNKSGKYLRDFVDWEWMCRSCHMKRDGRLKQLNENHIKKARGKCNAKSVIRLSD